MVRSTQTVPQTSVPQIFQQNDQTVRPDEGLLIWLICGLAAGVICFLPPRLCEPAAAPAMTRVGTGGPCAHCGRVSSPCWRKGPPEKPLLCNACGARFLVKHSLEGYVPNAKPAASKREGAPAKPKKEAGLRALGLAGRPGGEKRKRTLSKRCGARPAACMCEVSAGVLVGDADCGDPPCCS